MKTFILTILNFSVILLAQAQQSKVMSAGLQDSLLLKDYRPQSIFKTPQTAVLKAKYPAIDMHMHAPRGGNLDSIAILILKNMDEAGIQKTILFCETGKSFDKNAAAFGKYPERFELWCGLDLSGFEQPNFVPAVIAELERCVKLGAKGVGEISDKGRGLIPREGILHIDDPRMDPILEKLADLKLPISIHCGDPQWMYEPMDAHNDLLFESYFFKFDHQKGIPVHAELMVLFERALKKHPRTTFIACHFLNLTHDLDQLGRMLDKYQNLFVDVSARECYVAGIPRFAKKIIDQYADRFVYGTDEGFSISMYRNTFRIWETMDEHFYVWDISNTPWPLSGLGLSDETLKKLYRDNALHILNR
jgi:predicted TIM-barrel fold metal-dependent hydrolase